MPNLYSSQRIAQKKLKYNDNIVITKVDKGGQIVLIDNKNTYSHKVILFYEKISYIEIKRDFTN